MVWQKGRKTLGFRIDNSVYYVENTKEVLSHSLKMIISSPFTDKVFPGTSSFPE
jgi:hypothetical protein